MPSILDRFTSMFRGERAQAKPSKAQGVGGFAVYGGYIDQRETNAKLLGTERWRTASDILTNISVVAASVRFMMNLIARPEWSFTPAIESDRAAEEAAEFMYDVLYDMETSWTAQVRRMGMFRFYGFGMHEWVLKKRADGRVGMKSIYVRPPHTVTRWDMADDGGVLGVWQTDPQTGNEVYLPRAKVVYLVDDTLTDYPDGMGWFRHLVDPAERLKSLLLLEAIGFERDLSGIPVGRAPMSEMNEMVKSGQLTAEQRDSMLSGLRNAVGLERKTHNTGFLLDSQPYFATTADGENPSSVMQWGIDLLTGDPGSLEELGKAVNRLATDMALIMGTDVILTGRDGEGSRALSEDKSRNLYLNANSILCDIAECVDRDITAPIWAANGFPDELKPKAKVEDVAFRDVMQIAQALNDMAAAGGVLAPDDPAFDALRDLMGLPAAPPIDMAMLAAMRGKPDPAAAGEEDDDELDDDAAGAATAKLAPRPLYVKRELLNAKEVIAWAKEWGFTTTLPAEDMHVTVLFSRTPVDPMKMGTTWGSDENGNLTVQPGGPRYVEQFNGGAVVLAFGCDDLKWRHESMVASGASHDFDDYQSHVTLTYDAPEGMDVEAIEPYRGKLVFGPEIFENLDTDWKSKVTEKGGQIFKRREN